MTCFGIIVGYSYTNLAGERKEGWADIYVPHGCTTSTPLCNRISCCVTGHPVAQRNGQASKLRDLTVVWFECQNGVFFSERLFQDYVNTKLSSVAGQGRTGRHNSGH